MRILPVALLCALIPTAAALAAQPKTPAQFVGGGGGAPMMFKLNKNGKATRAAVAYLCKGANGQNLAESKKPRGRVQDDGTIVIRYRYKDSNVGRLRVRIRARFTSSTEAEGRVKIRSRKCAAKGYDFTAQAR
jgi:hypothetical protein